ncbi:MAG: nuclear transport factor 2 family protein [Caulobacter sp.]|nr:nuclear transport factor 2 family protein [Caulobacter sp.]
MTDHEALLATLYEAFNRQDLETLMAAMHPDVDWPNYLEGGRLKGKAALRNYWSRQFRIIRLEAFPISMETLDDGRVCVKVQYGARSVESGGLWVNEITTNTYSFDGGLITRMDWGVPESSALPPEAVISQLFLAFNRKDAAALTALLHPHVDWPDMFGTERLKGRQAVQAMWTYQFGKWDPHISLIEMNRQPDGAMRAHVSYVIRNKDGRLFTEEQATHRFEFRDGFISRMDVAGA